MNTQANKNQIKLPGGTNGQALVKLSNADYDFDWGNAGGSSGSNTVTLVAGNDFTGATLPQAFSVLSGQKTILSSGSVGFNQNLGDVNTNEKYCYQLNICEGQVVNIDNIRIIGIQGQGTNSDNLKLTIQGNTGNVPNGTAIQTSIIPGFSGLQTVNFPFTPFELSAPAGGGDKNYFVVLERTGAIDPVNYYILSLTNSGGTNTSAYRYNGATASWVNSDLKVVSDIQFTYLDGVAYMATRGVSATTKSANGTSGTVGNGTRIFAFDVGSSGGGWHTDGTGGTGFISDGANVARIRGFITNTVATGASVNGTVAGDVPGFTGLLPGENYILSRDSRGGITQATSASDIEAGQAIDSQNLLIHRVNV